jgi:hypothetical protein
VLPEDGPVRLETCRSWRVVILYFNKIECLFVVANCSNWFVMHGLDNVNFFNLDWIIVVAGVERFFNCRKPGSVGLN